MDAADSLMKEVKPAEEDPRTRQAAKYELVNECQNFLQAEFGGGDASLTTRNMAPVTEGNIQPTFMYERPYVDANPINTCLNIAHVGLLST